MPAASSTARNFSVRRAAGRPRPPAGEAAGSGRGARARGAERGQGAGGRSRAAAGGVAAAAAAAALSPSGVRRRRRAAGGGGRGAGAAAPPRRLPRAGPGPAPHPFRAGRGGGGTARDAAKGAGRRQELGPAAVSAQRAATWWPRGGTPRRPPSAFPVLWPSSGAVKPATTWRGAASMFRELQARLQLSLAVDTLEIQARKLRPTEVGSLFQDRASYMRWSAIQARAHLSGPGAGVERGKKEAGVGRGRF